MVWHKTAVTPLLTHWIHCNLALNHRHHDAWAMGSVWSYRQGGQLRGQLNRTCVDKVTIQIITCHVPSTTSFQSHLQWNSSIDTKTVFMGDFVKLVAANLTSHCTCMSSTISPVPCIKHHFQTSSKPFAKYRRPIKHSMMAPCSNGVIKYNAVVATSCNENIAFAVLIWPLPCIFNERCDVGPLCMAPCLVLRTIGSRELQDGNFVRIVNISPSWAR